MLYMCSACTSSQKETNYYSRNAVVSTWSWTRYLYLSLFSPGIPFSILQTPLCIVSSTSTSSSFFLSSSFFPSFTCFYLMVTRKKLFVCRENSILLSRVYFTISSRVRHTHIDVVVTKSSSFVMTLFSLILYYIYILSF